MDDLQDGRDVNSESDDEWPSSDESDDGFGSAESDPEEIIVDAVYPEALGQLSPLAREPSAPARPTYSPALHSEGVRRTHPYASSVSSITSMGYDSDASRIRNYVRCSKIFDGEGMLDGDEHRPKRITGMAIKQKKIIYFVQWTGKGGVSTPVEANLIKNSYPHLVVEFHEKMKLKPNRFKNI